MTEHLHRAQPGLIKAVGRVPDARRLEVIEIRFRRGEGCCDQDPVREVTAYVSIDGEFLAERDPFPAELATDPEPGT